VLPVIVGPRSALFSPLKNLGLVVMDECHDDSYYQREPAPSFSTQRVASRLAELYSAAFIMGSATPDISQQYFARKGTYQQVILSRRIITQPDQSGELLEDPGLPPVEIVDMREELKAGGRSMFSRTLQEALRHVLEAQEQAILFLNRRGTSTFIFCYDCGHSIRCPHCEIPLTFHSVDNSLLCHHCGYQRQMPKVCPNCKSERIRGFGIGTERVEVELKTLFPEARILRWDSETTQAKDANEIILGHFTAHHADFLVGTQMVAKGHDFPLVTLVGILLAESGLNLPDYRSPERAFQLITQVAGRAGRSEKRGKVVLQTYLPEH
jgi:primosomal protein N' (replication factor Y)